MPPQQDSGLHWPFLATHPQLCGSAFSVYFPIQMLLSLKSSRTISALMSYTKLNGNLKTRQKNWQTSTITSFINNLSLQLLVLGTLFSNFDNTAPVVTAPEIFLPFLSPSASLSQECPYLELISRWRHTADLFRDYYGNNALWNYLTHAILLWICFALHRASSLSSTVLSTEVPGGFS